MSKKVLLLTTIAILISQIILSQEPSKTQRDSIIFKDGTVKTGIVKIPVFLDTRKKKIKLCNNENKDCTKEIIADIDKIILSNTYDKAKVASRFRRTGTYEQSASKQEIIKVKALHRTEGKPILSFLVYESDKYDYYIFHAPPARTSYFPVFIYMTDKDSNIIKEGFRHEDNTKIKKNLERLIEIFNDCGALKNEYNKSTKEIKKKDLLYYIKIAEECSN